MGDFLPENVSRSTGNYSGYTAFWEVRDGYLCLQRVEADVYEEVSKKKSTRANIGILLCLCKNRVEDNVQLFHGNIDDTMRRKIFYLWACVFLLGINCIDTGQKNVKVSEASSQVLLLGQNEGWNIIEALSKTYGDKPNIIGDFIGNSRCPDFLEEQHF